MIQSILKNRLLAISVHILLGYLATLSFFPKFYGIGIVLLSIFLLIQSQNKNEEALLLSSYVVGAEVFIRMIKGFPTYETGKYAAIFLLIIGLVYNNKNKIGIQYVFYLLLLLLGIVFTQVPEGESLRKAIVFNLSGPVVLGVSAIYFYMRKINKKKLLNALFFMLLPLFSMVTYLYFRTPDLSEIVFGGSANFETSGGFGPNQVATAIGLGIFIILVFIQTKEKLSGYIILDSIFLIYFIYRGLLTFSRGGILTALISLVIFFIFYALHNKGSFSLIFKYLFIGSIFTISIWLYTSEATGGMLNNRYTGKNAKGETKEDITSGRAKIITNQFENFIQNPLGIGVGNGKYERQLSGENITAASHNEVGRLIEEHGGIGLIILIILFISPLSIFLNSSNYDRAFLISFYFLWFLTINHSAMRIAFPGFIYGLSLINIYDEEDES